MKSEVRTQYHRVIERSEETQTRDVASGHNPDKMAISGFSRSRFSRPMFFGRHPNVAKGRITLTQEIFLIIEDSRSP